MSKRVLLKYWLPVVAWMIFIFVGSGDVLSGRQTSRFLVPFIHQIMPWLSPAGVETVAYYVRKGGHVTEYGVLALLLWRAFRRPLPKDSRPWDRFLVRRVLLWSVIYAASDEFHQSFVPSREARVHDVVIHSCGAAAALWLLWFIGRRRKQW